MNRKTFHRFLVYGVLVIAALLFLAPMYVMLVTSFKDAEQIRAGNLMSLPTSLNWASWQMAWNQACTGVDCRGLRPYFWNSVSMAVPAVLISTSWGAINGYVLSMWKFRGSDVLFGFLLFGVFMPFQVVLLPMSQVLGYLNLSSSVGGLILADRASHVHAHPDGDPDLAVHQHLERLFIWCGLQWCRQQTHHRGSEQHGQHHQQRQELQRGHGSRRHRGFTHHGGVRAGGSVFCEGAHGWRCERINTHGIRT
jgi:hypothetical protein